MCLFGDVLGQEKGGRGGEGSTSSPWPQESVTSDCLHPRVAEAVRTHKKKTPKNKLASRRFVAGLPQEGRVGNYHPPISHGFMILLPPFVIEFSFLSGDHCSAML